MTPWPEYGVQANVNIYKVKCKYFRSQNKIHHRVLNKKILAKDWGQEIVINNLYWDKFCNLLFKMFSLPPYLVNHKTSYTCFYPLKRTELLSVDGNEMHLKESKWTLRCGNKVSAYFQKPQMFDILGEEFCLFVFCFDGCSSGRMEGEQRATTLKT